MVLCVPLVYCFWQLWSPPWRTAPHSIQPLLHWWTITSTMTPEYHVLVVVALQVWVRTSLECAARRTTTGSGTMCILNCVSGALSPSRLAVLVTAPTPRAWGLQPVPGMYHSFWFFQFNSYFTWGFFFYVSFQEIMTFSQRQFFASSRNSKNVSEPVSSLLFVHGVLCYTENFNFEVGRLLCLLSSGLCLSVLRHSPTPASFCSPSHEYFLH